MNYILFGEEEYLIKKRINKIKKDFFKEEENIKTFNYYDDGFDIIFNSLVEIDLSFFQNKMIIVYDCDFLSILKEFKKLKKEEVQNLISTLNENSETCILFITYKENLLKNNPIVDCFKNNGKIYSFLKIKKGDYLLYIKKSFENKGYNIDEKSINRIYEKIGQDLYAFENEFNKLILYKQDDKNISLNDINEICSSNIDNNIFDLCDAILNNDKNHIFNIYKNLVELNNEPVEILNVLIKNFIFYDEIKYLSSLNKNENEISTILNANYYRVLISLKNISKFSLKKIREVLNKLYKLDIKIKSSELNRFTAFELFLLEI